MAWNQEFIELKINQVDDKHTDAHARLREDISSLETEVGQIKEDVQRNYNMLLTHQLFQKERRKELSSSRVVIYSAIIGGGFRLIEVLINSVTTFLHTVK